MTPRGENGAHLTPSPPSLPPLDHLQRATNLSPSAHSAALASPSCENNPVEMLLFNQIVAFLCSNPPVAHRSAPPQSSSPSLHWASSVPSSLTTALWTPLQPQAPPAVPATRQRPCLTAFEQALDWDLSSPGHVPGSLPTSFESCFKSYLSQKKKKSYLSQ